MQQAPNVLTCFIQNVAWKISGLQVFFGTWVSLTKDVSDVWKPMDYPRKFPFVLVLVVVVQQPERIHGSWGKACNILFLDKVVWIKIGNKNPAITLVVNLMMVKRNKSASREYSIPQSHWNGKTYLETTIMFTIASTTHSSCNFTINVKITFAD